MVVGLLSVDIRLFGPTSLKDKRRIIKGTLARVANKFNMSVAEVGYLETWNRSELGFSCVSNDAGHVENMMAAVVRFLESDPELEICDVLTECIHT